MPIEIDARTGLLPPGMKAKDPQWWRDMMLSDLFFLCKVILHHGKKQEYRDLNDVHRKLCDFLSFEKNPIPQKLVLMFRDGLKSSIARAMVIQDFLRCCYERREFKEFYYSGVFELAQDQLERIVKEILENQLIQAFFQKYIPSRKQDFDICAVEKGRIRYGGMEIELGSPDKPLTGFHFNKGINDNLVTVTNSATANMRNKIVKLWQQQESILVENAPEIVFETTWYPDDVAGTILNPEGKFDFSRLRRRPCYTFISDMGYAVFSCPAASGEGKIGKPVFPEKVDQKYLERKRAKQGAAIYSAMYELQPIAEGDAVFRNSWIRDYMTLPNPFIRNLTIDMSGTKGRESTHSAISIGEWSAEAILHIPYAEKRKVSPMELVAWYRELLDQCEREQRPIFATGIEREKFGIFLADYLLRQPWSKHLNIQTIPLNGIPRPDRMFTLQAPLENGQILLKPGLNDLKDEIRTYYRDKNTNVDLLDTLYLHQRIKMLPKKGIFLPAEKQDENDFVAQVRKDRRPLAARARYINANF